MKGEERYILELLEGRKMRFRIPVYQRNYDWKIEQCKRLFDDIEEVLAEERKTHFFGSVVCKEEYGERIVIDGQQRITTLFLLLVALVRQVEEGLISISDDEFADTIREDYLIDKRRKDAMKLKLKLIKDDQEAYRLLFDTTGKPLIGDSNVTQNYRYFLQRLIDTQYEADQILEALNRLMVIDIVLSSDDDAQLIFESLNSTGLDLSEGDKIRNYVLMDLDTDLQDEYYENYWNPIEKNTNYDVSGFVRDWLAARDRKTPTIKKVYTVFRERMKGNSLDTKGVLEEMLEYSRYYQAILSADTGYVEVDRTLFRISLLDTSVVNPFLLNFFKYWYDDCISTEEVAKVLKSVETYIFRRWVCKVPTNALNKVFETLHAEALRGVENGSPYCDVLNYILLRKEGSGRLPDDEEFLSGMTDRDFYHIGNNKFYLYECLENTDSRERVNVVERLEDDTFTVEHIMPQTLSAAWKSDLGDGHKEIHDKWLNKLANLTLTGYNSQYSNKRFAEKRDAKNGFSDSGLRINRWISGQGSWGEAQLEERDRMLRSEFLERWPMPTSEYVPMSEIHEEVSLSDDFDFRYRKIAAYSFMGSRYTVKSFADMILGVLSLVGELEPVLLRKYTQEKDFPARYFSNLPGEYYFEVAEGVYFNPGSSTETKCNALKRIFDRAGIEYDELSFELYKTNGEDSVTEG